MRCAAMNDPARPLAGELRRLHGLGFEALDVTLEPPGAWPVDGAELARTLDELGVPAVGHTAYHLPIASQFDSVEAAARDDYRRQLAAFAEADVRLVNVHPQRHGFEHRPRDEVHRRNGAAIARLCEDASAEGCSVMVENLIHTFGTVEALSAIFEAAPSARWHLDIGHAHAAGPGTLDALLASFGDRLVHVHVHDNDGTADQHLPLGEGTLDVEAAARALHQQQYDGLVTIEVFDDPGRSRSRDLWQAAWDAASSSTS
jgi:sugar phosphate isomerase/epimerase